MGASLTSSKHRTSRKKKGRVLITGGSGFLGINLCRYLYKHGYDINVIDIAPFDYPDMKGKIKFFHGDIRNTGLLEKSMTGCDFVVHSAAALPLYKPEEIFSVDVEGTRNVLSVAKKLGVKRFVHISSTAVYGIPDHHPLYEDDPLSGVGPYGEAKVQAEKVCEQFRNEGMCVTILRPKSFVGPERLGVFAIYYDWIARDKNIPIIGNGKNRYQLLDVEDLCEAIRLCLVRPKSKVNDVFNIGAKEFTTMKEDFGAVLEYRGSGKRVIPIPAKPLILLLRVLEALRLSPLYKWVYETAPHDSFVSVEKAEKMLGFTPKYSNKEALIRNYEWYMANRHTFKETGVSHRVPWKQGILKVASWFF
ncbi:NAD(P)-dependent oxidoreductase [Candidatus Woesearchaeota archaeon]|nr:MAG: NAD(P)-dependent oxidoreductase [Candidatus Woesearchaeota archaeon]